jgi:hypothetical protein
MKKILAFFMFLLLFANSNILVAEIEDEPGDCFVQVKVDPELEAPGTLAWSDEARGCVEDPPGQDCEIIPCDEYCDGRSETVSGYVKIGLHYSGTQYAVTDEDGNIFPWKSDGKNYTFTGAHILIIKDYDAHPELNGTVVNLKGIRTDNTGYYEITIPIN